MSTRRGSSRGNNKQSLKDLIEPREPSTRPRESPIKLNDYDLKYSPPKTPPKIKVRSLNEADKLDQKNKRNSLSLGQSSQKVI